MNLQINKKEYEIPKGTIIPEGMVTIKPEPRSTFRFKGRLLFINQNRWESEEPVPDWVLMALKMSKGVLLFENLDDYDKMKRVINCFKKEK